MKGCLGYRDYVIPAEPIPKAAKRAAEQAALQKSLAEASRQRKDSRDGDNGNGNGGGGAGGGMGGDDEDSDGLEDGQRDENDGEPGVGEEGSVVHVANERNFNDEVVWGGYMLSEVTVFYEQNQGIMGITATAKVRMSPTREVGREVVELCCYFCWFCSSSFVGQFVRPFRFANPSDLVHSMSSELFLISSF